MLPTIHRVRDDLGHLRVWRVTLADGSEFDFPDSTSDSRDSYALAAEKAFGGGGAR